MATDKIVLLGQWLDSDFKGIFQPKRFHVVSIKQSVKHITIINFWSLQKDCFPFKKQISVQIA